jgi:hypothetical protein
MNTAHDAAEAATADRSEVEGFVFAAGPSRLELFALGGVSIPPVTAVEKNQAEKEQIRRAQAAIALYKS